MKTAATRITLPLLLLLLTGCREPMPGGRPDVQLEMYRRTVSRQYSYFVVKRTGDLAFGGGKLALTRTTKPIARLTVAQQERLRALLIESDLMNRQSVPFARPETVEFEVGAKLDGRRRSVRLIDGGAAALEPLHDWLMSIRAEANFGQMNH